MSDDKKQTPYPWRDYTTDSGYTDDENHTPHGERTETQDESEYSQQTDVDTPQVTDDHTALPQEFAGSDDPDYHVVDREVTGQQTKKIAKSDSSLTTVLAGLRSYLPSGGSAPSTGQKTGLAGFFYPDGMLRADEEVVFEAHPTRWMDAKNHLIGTVLMSVAIGITTVTLLGFGEDLWNAPLPGSGRQTPSQWYILPLLLFSVGGLVYLYAAVRRASTWYLLTQTRLLKRKGILRRQDKRIRLSDINKTNTIRPPHMYLFGVGHIDVYTAATGGSEIRIEACRNISDRAELIDYQSKLAQMNPEERKRFAEKHAHAD